MHSIYPHQNDCWHYIRNIEKALWHAAKLKSCGAEIGRNGLQLHCIITFNIWPFVATNNIWQ